MPTASQVVALGQATPKSSVPGTTTVLPGMPLVIGTTTPSSGPEELTPTGSQVVALGQATPPSWSEGPGTTTALPGMPLVIGTTTPSKGGFPTPA